VQEVKNILKKVVYQTQGASVPHRGLYQQYSPRAYGRFAGPAYCICNHATASALEGGDCGLSGPRWSDMAYIAGIDTHARGWEVLM
jgi:hypothetical protein